MIAEIKPGTFINNRYLISKLLGQGGFGRTYLAFDHQRFGEPCVLKEFVPANTKADLLSKSQELFEREAKVLYQIQHPQIPAFQAWFTEENRLFIVQEYIDGKTYWQILYDRLTEHGSAFSETEVRTWLIDLLPVLSYIHERKIIHRDISLENIMCSNKNSLPILIDFGVVKEKFTQLLTVDSLNPWHSLRGSVVGKIGYSPMEQIRLGHCYPSSDIYALGVCAVVLLTGKMPHLLIDGSLNWQWRSQTRLSESFALILEKMLADLPSDRYQSANEVLLQLRGTQTPHIASQSPKKLINISQTQKNYQDSLILEQLEQKLSQASEVTTTDTPTPVSSNTEFLAYCQRQLTNFVGPLASVLMRHTLEKTPQITPKKFVEAITAAIPNLQRAQEFRNSIQLPPEPKLNKLHPNSHELIPAISNPKFLETCERELMSFVGPFASVIIKDALDQQPNLTPKQLIETLVAEIPSHVRAQQFKERLYLLKPK
jgi:serine/threonine protein kinase